MSSDSRNRAATVRERSPETTPSRSRSGPPARRALLPLLALLAAPGCHAPPPPTPRQLEQGLIWVFPGIEGGPRSMSAAVRGWRDAGVRSAVRVHSWNRPFRIIANLTDYEGNLAAARSVAREITAYRRDHPHVAIDLVGYSGGGGFAIMVAEALPADLRLRHVILCHPAISPGYDLTAALRRIDGKLVNFYSIYDVVMLGAGTSIFGTMDREHGPSAGMRGFDEPPNVSDPTLAARVVQHAWRPEMIEAGHPGEHFGMLTAPWNARYVAPYLRAGKGGQAYLSPGATALEQCWNSNGPHNGAKPPPI